MPHTRNKKQRAAGAGRPANSEPRQQVFSNFTGMNIANAPFDFDESKSADPAQNDLQMSYLAIQNNVQCANGTLLTEPQLKQLASIIGPPGDTFNGVSLLVGDELYLATNQGKLLYGNIVKDGLEFEYINPHNGHSPEQPAGGGINNKPTPGTMTECTITNRTDIAGLQHHFTGLAYVDDKIVATTKEGYLYQGALGTHELHNAKPIKELAALELYNNIKGMNDLSLHNEYQASNPYRIGIAFAYVNEFGPSKISPITWFYSNKPVNEFNANAFLRIEGTPYPDGKLQAAEFYYATGNSDTLLYAGRMEMNESSERWHFHWFGYLDATRDWTIANLTPSNENLSGGVKARYLTVIDGRVYFWGDPENPYRLWIGGNPGNLLSVATGSGGGFVDVEPGTGQEIKYVVKYKTSGGASIVTMLCSSANSRQERRYNLVENQITLSNEQQRKSWQAEQVPGTVGCKSVHGAVVCADGLYAVSRYGLSLTTMTMEYNAQLRTTYVSDAVKPLFTDRLGKRLANSWVIDAGDLIYIAFGRDADKTDNKEDTHEGKDLDNLIAVYDVNSKAWWTINVNKDYNIVGLMHIDSETHQEGIGIIASRKVLMLPTTIIDEPEKVRLTKAHLETAALSTQMPQQAWLHLTQIEFRFDWFRGKAIIKVIGLDYFGRKLEIKHAISEASTVYNLREYMRIDAKFQSYRIVIEGECAFRLTHWIAKEYPMSSRVGITGGFDSLASHRSQGDIHPRFKTYNDIKQALNL